MKAILKGLPIIATLFFMVGCGTVATVEQKKMHANSNAFENKKVSITDNYRRTYWKDGIVHMIGSKPQPGETLEHEYDINKKLPKINKYDFIVSAEAQGKTIPMLKMLKPKIEQMISMGKGSVVQDNKGADYEITATITFGPTPMPAYAERNMGESMGKRLLTLGLVPTGYYTIKNDYKLKLALKTKQGKEILNKEYIVNNSVQQSVSDLSFSQHETNTETVIKLYESSLNDKLNDFLSSIKTL